MFASLVVVFPTPHQGGSLLFRHGDVEYTFDTAAALANAATPSVAFAAFYSDVEHEVTAVESGYRVTLTYNLYLESAPQPSVLPFTGAYESALKAAFESLLTDETFLPTGGNVGFGLRHEYPLGTSMARNLKYLDDALKGSDAVLMKVCKDLNLTASVRILYRERGIGYVLCTQAVPKGSWSDEDHFWRELVRMGGKVLWPPAKQARKYFNAVYGTKSTIQVHWATPKKPVDVKEGETPYLAHGNEPAIGFAYHTLCLIVKIPVVEERMQPQEVRDYGSGSAAEQASEIHA